MTETRYSLTQQMHFHADTPTRADVIVTVQRWDAVTTKRPQAVYVVCVNGTEVNRRLCTKTSEMTHLATVMQTTADQHRTDLLSEEAAAAKVTERGGPKLRWCHRKDCGEPVPYASAQCAHGHPTDSVGAIQFLAAHRKHAAAIGGGRRG